MSDSDRLRRLRELRKALDAAPGATPGGGQAEPAPVPARDAEERIPQVGARPSGSGRAAALEPPSPKPTTPAAPAVAARPCLLCGESHAAGMPCARPPAAGAVEGPAVPGTRAELAAESRGWGPLVLLESSLSFMSTLEPWHIGVVSAVLMVLGVMVAYASGSSVASAVVTITATGALPVLLKFASDALFRSVIIPGMRLQVTDLHWMPETRRAQVCVSVSCDVPLSGNWKRAVQVVLGTDTEPAPILGVTADRFDEGSKLDIALLLEARQPAIGSILTWVRSPDGRLVGMDARVQRFREARCGRCLGEDPACALCGGSRRVQEAMF